MKFIFNKVLPAIFIAFSFVFLSSCGKDESQAKPLTIAINSWAGYSFALLAEELGYFNKDDKQSISFIVYPSLSESKKAYIDGHVDGMFSTIYEMLDTSRYEHKHPKIVLVTNISNGADQILATKNYNNIKELVNKRIGVEENSIGMYMLNRAIQLNKLSTKDFIIKYLNVDKMKLALENDEIDAAVTYLPELKKVLSIAPNQVFHSGQIKDEILDILVIDNSSLVLKLEQVKLLIGAWKKAYNYYLDNPLKANLLLNNRSELKGLSLSEDLNGIEIMDYSNPNSVDRLHHILKNSFQLMVDMETEKGKLVTKISPDDVIYEDLLLLHQSD